MPRPRRRSNRTCSPPSSPATPSWSRDRSARGWGPSSRRCNVAIAAQAVGRRTVPRLTHAVLALRILGHDRAPQRLPLHHVPHRRGDDHGARVRVPVRPLDHRPPAAQAGQGPADPHRRAAVASRHQEGHAHHGRADDPVRARGLDAAVGQSGQPLRLDRARRDAHLRRDRLLRRLPQGHQADPCRLFRQAPLADRGRDRGDRLLLHRRRSGASRLRPRSPFPSSRSWSCRSAGSSSCSAPSSSSAPAMR